MGGRNRRWHNSKSHYDGPRRPPPPPPPPGPGHSDGNNQCPVPSWEREFCSHVGGISWKRFCENKQFSSIYKDIEQWDDSAAFENFQNAKSRFCAHYHGQSSDIPLPDPDMYIDRVDHSCEVDPELVAELDKVRLPFEADNVYAPATGWDNTEANNKCAPNQSGNWDIYLEKLSESNKWEDSSRPNTGWGEKHDPLNKWSKDSSGWGDAPVKPLNQWSKNSSGWGAALVNPSWGSSSNNYCPPNNWNSGHANKDQWSTYGRKRNSGGGCSQQRNNKQRNQDEGNQQRGRWQDRRGGNGERFPFDSRQNGQRW